MKDFYDIATALGQQFNGTLVPSSAVKYACFKHDIAMPTDLPFVKTGKRGGRLDLSAWHKAETIEIRTVDQAPSECTGLPVFAECTGLPVSVIEESPEPPERDRFAALALMAQGIIEGHYRATVVSGNPGIGKTFTLEKLLNAALTAKKIKKLSVVHGYSRATGLYRLLYQHRGKGQVIMFDDCDSVLGDETALSLLKAALDTTKTRTVSWHSERPFKDDEGDNLPKSFAFEGTVIFITNVNFDAMRTTKLGVHLDAFMSRAFYVDLHMRSDEELLRRIEYVLRTSTLLSAAGLDDSCADPIMQYIREHRRVLREVSLRTAVKLANVLRASKTLPEFQTMANALCCR